MGLFRHLQAKALALPTEVLDQVAEWLRETSWPCREFFLQVAAIAQSSTGERNDRLIIKAPAAPEPLRGEANPPKLAAEDALAILNGAKGRPDVLAEILQVLPDFAVVFPLIDNLADDFRIALPDCRCNRARDHNQH